MSLWGLSAACSSWSLLSNVLYCEFVSAKERRYTGISVGRRCRIVFICMSLWLSYCYMDTDRALALEALVARARSISSSKTCPYFFLVLPQVILSKQPERWAPGLSTPQPSYSVCCFLPRGVLAPAPSLEFPRWRVASLRWLRQSRRMHWQGVRLSEGSH